MARKKTKIYGFPYRGRFILRPLRRLPFMALVPCAIRDTREECEAAAAQYNCYIEWHGEVKDA